MDFKIGAKAIICLLLYISINVQAQYQDVIDDVYTEQDEDIDYTSLYEELSEFVANPININSATKDEMTKIPFITDIDAQKIIEYRQRYGEIKSINELININGFNEIKVRRLSPFVTLASTAEKQIPFNLKNIYRYGNHTLLLRTSSVIEPQKGYENPCDYLGDSYHHYLKYKFRYSQHIEAGFISEKDAGEMLIDSTGNLDYISGYVMLKDIGKIKNLVVGDYDISLGQGLTFWKSFALSKSTYIMNIRKKSSAISKYSSTDENRFLRGVASTINHKNWSGTGFVSHKKNDAIFNYADDIKSYYSLTNTGYHNTDSDYVKKDNVQETILGGSVNYTHNIFKIGANYGVVKYNHEIIPSAYNYTQFAFRGDENRNLSVNYDVLLNRYTFFGEIAQSLSGGMATLNGGLFDISPYVNISVLHRYYDVDYQSIYGNGFGEQSTTQNENGLFIGTEILPLENGKITAYYDVFEHNWLKYRTDAPSIGYEYLLQTDYDISAEISLSLRYKYKLKNENSSTTALPMNTIVDVEKQQLRLRSNWEINSQLTANLGVESLWFKKESVAENGFMMYQEIKFKPSAVPITFNFRYAIFSTESYDSRLYAYESDVLYAFSIPSYYDEGSKFYGMIRYEINSNFDFWLKYSQTYYDNLSTISSGLNEINGNKKSEIKLQVRMKF